jgi:Zn-dependent protease
MRFAPAFWVSFVVLVLVHEIGHAVFVQRLGHRALSVDVTGFGGLCHWDPRGATALHAYVIAWGGVVAQTGLLVVALGYTWIAGPPNSEAEAQIVSAFTRTNLWLIAVNLLPIAPLDGASAWKLFGELRRQRLTLWRLLQTWAARRKAARQPNGPGPKARPAPPPPSSAPGNKESAASGEAQRELARLFEKVAEEARRAREKK